MSAGCVVSHPRFAAAPVKNPPMRKGPKPKGTLSFYAGRRRQQLQRWREKDRENQRLADSVPQGVRREVTEVTHRLAFAAMALDIPKLQRLVEAAEKMVRELVRERAERDH
jgi:hypothetical protein